MSDFSGTYDVLAPRWDDWAGRVVPDLRAEWAGKVDAHVTVGERVVELGCGTGVPVGRLLSARYEYVGVDTSDGMLARAREGLPKAELTRADMHTLQFAPGSVGAVVAFFSISHTPRDQHAGLFAEIASWLRPGGAFVGNVHSRDDPDGYDDDWLGAGPMSWSGFDGDANLALLAAAGFTIVEHAVVRLVEPDGGEIAPLWFVATKQRN